MRTAVNLERSSTPRGNRKLGFWEAAHHHSSGGIPEYADEQSAIILERGDQLVDQLADAMTKIARDSDERDAMGAHKTALRSEFNKEAYMAQLAIRLR